MMHYTTRLIVILACVFLTHLFPAQAAADFRVKPYLLRPEPDTITVVWFTDDDTPGTLTVESNGLLHTYTSEPAPALALTYHPAELEHLPVDAITTAPYKHTIHVTNLWEEVSTFTVEQGETVHQSILPATLRGRNSVRFIVFADCETEPESTGKHTNWPEPNGDMDRVYPVDQTEGFRQNLHVIQQRKPDFLAFAGDLAESGGEQRDWDEFWRHLNGDYGTIAGSTPIVAAPGNHDAFGGPGQLGGFGRGGHSRADEKFRAYFQTRPDDHHPPQGYHRLDYGPITLISIDSTNGLPDNSEHDTNWLLTARDHGHDFNPGSDQYRWLEKQLADAQKRSRFTFVQFHHVPYSVGPHGFPAGNAGHDHGEDNQSGKPMRVLTELFMRYGVDAVFAGHDEMYEHSVIKGGQESLPGEDGKTRPHELHVLDVGIAGDGLRGPFFGPGGRHESEVGNPYQVFLAHHDAPEVWDGKRLVSGGKHYGHLEVNITQSPEGTWQVKLTPVYIFPLMDAEGAVTGWERRVYEDEVTLTEGVTPPQP